MPRICVAIQAETTVQTIKSVLDAEQADLIEIRLDYRKEPLDLPSIRLAPSSLSSLRIGEKIKVARQRRQKRKD